MNTIIPKYITNKAIYLYLGLLAVVLVLFRNPQPWYFILFGIVSCCIFFYYGNVLSKQWHPSVVPSNKLFEKRLFWTAFGIRLLFVVLCPLLYNSIDCTYGPNADDAGFYQWMGEYGAELMDHDRWNVIEEMQRYAALSDTGYPMWLAIIFYITGFTGLFLIRLLKVVLSSLTVLLLYRLASRNFEESVARMTGVISMLMPNLVFYCGQHLKETEMVFLVILFIEEIDILLRKRKFSFRPVVLALFAVSATFLFRTALAVVMILTVLTALVFSSTKLVNWGRRILMFVLAGAFLFVSYGNRIGEEVSDFSNSGQTALEQQQTNMQWRTQRAGGGNKFAKYAGAAVFAPLIFTIPFPTYVNVEGQNTQMMINGGNYVKNVLSGFVIFGLFILLFTGEWREHVLPLAMMLGYLVVLVFSEFAQSERFHLPVLPFELMFAAYGISRATQPKHKRWFNYWMAFVVLTNLAWQWFKMKGRGMM